MPLCAHSLLSISNVPESGKNGKENKQVKPFLFLFWALGGGYTIPKNGKERESIKCTKEWVRSEKQRIPF